MDLKSCRARTIQNATVSKDGKQPTALYKGLYVSLSSLGVLEMYAT